MFMFTSVPGPHAPADRRAEFRIACDEPRTIDVRFTDAQSGELLAAKRFADVSEAVFDAAPIARRRIGFAPQAGSASGFVAADDRMLALTITAATAEEPDTEIAAQCIFYAGDAPVPALVARMPLRRLIGPGEWDELTMLSQGPLQATVTAKGPTGEQTRSYVSGASLVKLFRLRAADFPEAEQLTVDFGSVGSVVYSVSRFPHDARRLAWRSRAGSLEHYTFPTEAATEIGATKTRVLGPDGYATAAAEEERRIRLRSACETRAAAEALAEIVAAPDVWLIVGDRYEPVDVATDTAAIQRQGMLTTLEIAIRPRKTAAL